MKQFSLLILFSIVSFLAQSQDIKVKKGRVTIDKELYCLYDEESSNILFAKNYTIKSVDGTELFFVKRESVQVGETVALYIVFLNLQTEEEFEIDQPMTGSTLKFIMKHFYNSEVLSNEGINEDGLEKFKMKYAGEFKAKYEAEADRITQSKPDVIIINGDENEYELTERNRNATIYIFGKTIKQGTVAIGTYARQTELEEGEIIEVFVIYDINNRLIARAEKKQFGEVVSFVTKKDNEKRTLRVTSTLERDTVEAIVRELIEYMYL